MGCKQDQVAKLPNSQRCSARELRDLQAFAASHWEHHGCRDVGLRHANQAHPAVNTIAKCSFGTLSAWGAEPPRLHRPARRSHLCRFPLRPTRAPRRFHLTPSIRGIVLLLHHRAGGKKKKGRNPGEYRQRRPDDFKAK